ncbi:MAG: MMPL family transporter [Actinomycetota bacterium]|nr:MMPL family transporter [Actinomycetota bacterium]
MLDRLAHLIGSRPKRVVVIAVVLFGIAGAIGSGVADRLTPYDAVDPATESARATAQLEAAGYHGTEAVVLIQGVDARASAGVATVKDVERRVMSIDGVRDVNGFRQTGATDFLSKDRDATYLGLTFEMTADKAVQEVAEALVLEFAGDPAVTIGGNAVAQFEINQQVESDLQRAELIAFPLLLLLSLMFFRSLVAALLPLLVGGLAIVSTLMLLSVASELTPISIFALNLVTGLGLGLAIDYSLFVVSRYREELARTGPGMEALRRTMATSGRTVLFSSLTVAGALAALCVFPQNFLRSMGIGGSLVALAAAVIALTVLPAVLALLGNRVNALSPAFLRRRAELDSHPAESGFWYRLSRTVMRAPGRIALVSIAVLLALGVPFLGIKFTSVDAQTLPTSASARQVDDVLRADFPPFRDSPIRLVVSGDRREAAALAREARALDGVAQAGRPVKVVSDVWLVEAVSATPPLDDRSTALVADLRTLPGDVLVGGFSAQYEDLGASLIDHLPLVLALVSLATFVVLFLMTGSVILPLKQLVMNLLGISAVFGILVLIFQDGRFESLLGYTSQGGLESTQPLLLFAVAFGLSTDYGVFLLARIKEAKDSGYSDSESVAVGLERTGRIVTAAALLFCIAIGAFVTSEIIFVKQLGLGTALAVLIDATIIRALLVPSLMEMLGRWNWWAPAPLRRLHRRFGLSET